MIVFYKKNLFLKFILDMDHLFITGRDTSNYRKDMTDYEGRFG